MRKFSSVVLENSACVYAKIKQVSMRKFSRGKRAKIKQGKMRKFSR